MAEELASIQDVIRRRRAGAFVGRDGQLALFRENLDLSALDERKRFLFNVHGEGGVGKSTLLERWRLIARRHGALEARVDEHVYGVPEAMAALANQLGDGAMKEFRRRYDSYLRGREQLEHDPQAPRELWSQVIRTGVKAGLHASRVVPGAAPVVDLLDGDVAADAVDQVRVFLTRKLRDSRDVRLLLSPTEELTPPFVAGLASLATHGKVLLFFDTFEQTGAFLEGWLLDLFAGQYGSLPLQLTLVIAGRLPLNPNRWSEYLSLVAPIPLAPFTEAEARQLLAAEDITDERTVEVILALSGGLPLLVDTLAKNRPTNDSMIGDPTGTAVERFLRWEPDEARRHAALVGSLPRRIDADLLAIAIDTDDARQMFDWLSDQPFIGVHDGQYQYHEVVRAPMLRWQRQRSYERWRADHSRLADRYQKWREELEPGGDWSIPTWRECRIEETYHRLAANQAMMRSVIRDGIAAAKAGAAVARRWAEMIEEVGRDLDDEDIGSCGTRLQRSVDSDTKDCQDFLTALLQLGHLDAAHAAQALAERALIHYLADRDEQAIQDCSLAIDRDGQCADAYSTRGAAHSALGRYQQALADFDHALIRSPDNVWAISRRGHTYERMERHDEALADFNRAVELDPNSDWAVIRRGETYLAMKRYDDALADFNRAIELDPNSSWALARRGETHRLMKRYDDALADANRAAELDPNSSWALASRGETYRLMKRYDDALADFNRAAELDPNSSWTIGSRGQTYRAMERYDDALADFNRAIELDPKSDWLVGERGETYRLMERYDDALADFNRAVELKPNSDWHLADRGEIYRQLERYDDALTDLNRAIELDPNYSFAIASRGQTYRQIERYDDALTDLNRAIELDPNYRWALACRGQTYRQIERYDDALTDLNRAIELDPNSSWAISERGETYRLTDRHDDALADFNRAIELDPNYSWALASRGQTYRMMRRYEDAWADFNRAIELDPNYKWAIGGRGETYRLMKRYDDALADFNRAIELDSNYSYAIASRGQIYRVVKRYDDALADFNRAIDIDPNSDWAIGERGETYRRMKRYDDAIADFNRAIDIDPKYAWFYAHRAHAYRDLGLAEEAELDLSRARALDPAYDWSDPDIPLTIGDM